MNPSPKILAVKQSSGKYSFTEYQQGKGWRLVVKPFRLDNSRATLELRDLIATRYTTPPIFLYSTTDTELFTWLQHNDLNTRSLGENSR